jgi:hypothetical protein
MTFVMGSFTADVKPLAARYLGGLPSTARRTSGTLAIRPAILIGRSRRVRQHAVTIIFSGERRARQPKRSSSRR